MKPSFVIDSGWAELHNQLTHKKKKNHYLYNFLKDIIYVMEMFFVRNMHFILPIEKNI